MITLDKAGASARINLDKTADMIRVRATWTDNGDGRDDNDDLDLRAGILMPDGKMHWLAASHPGDFNSAPFARHLGDVTSASEDAPGEEIIEINPAIAQKMGGPVAMVFSVYSAISNGAVSIASLNPIMSVEYGSQRVDAAFKFQDGPSANGVYTYVIGVVDIVDGEVSIQASGATSPKGSENTPWITRTGKGVEVSFDGTPVFKKGRGFFGRLIGAGKKGYVNA